MFWCLAIELSRMGHDLRAITSDSLNAAERIPIRQEQLAERLHVSRYRNRFNRWSAHFGGIFFRPVGMGAAVHEAAAWADVIHMGESRGPHNLWSANASRKSAKPLVWSPYGGLPLANGLRGIYRAAYDVAFTSSVIPVVSRFIAQTEHEKEVILLRGAQADRIKTIPLCVDWSEFEQPPVSGGLRTRIGIRPKDNLIVSVARLSPVKGLDILMRSFARLPQTAAGPFLALVGWDHGSGSMLRRLAADLGVNDRVMFVGALLGKERMLAYSDADVFALAPRVFEETSLAALEAAACGVPTVLTRECEIPGLIESGGGLVVERSEAALAAGIQSLLESPDLRVKLGRAARQAVRERFTTERIAEAHEAVFNEVALR